jgi:S-formylglutathione hydrolase FrmB
MTGIGVSVALALGGCGGTSATRASTAATAPDEAPAPASSFVVVPAPSLDGNLLGDPAELEVALWLPPSYGSSSMRYPVVYFLAGYGETASTASIGAVLEQLITEGAAPEMILVGVDGINAFGGSFYVDSTVTGNWAEAIHDDLVGYVDANLRTLPTPASRGIAGFSMGGFGALDVAMRHPDVFGAVYALSPGLLAPGALESTQMFAGGDAAIDEFLALQAGEREIVAGSEALTFSVAYGAAFAPDPGGAFPYVDYPYTAVGSPRDAASWARWESGYGGVAAEIEEFQDNLRSLRGIALDYGTNDPYAWIPEGCAYFTEQLAAHSITAQVTPYEGGHGPIGPRADAVMFPFFADVLER